MKKFLIILFLFIFISPSFAGEGILNKVNNFLNTPNGQSILCSLMFIGQPMTGQRCMDNAKETQVTNNANMLAQACSNGDSSACIYLQNILNERVQKRLQEQNQRDIDDNFIIPTHNQVICRPDYIGGYICE